MEHQAGIYKFMKQQTILCLALCYAQNKWVLGNSKLALLKGEYYDVLKPDEDWNNLLEQSAVLKIL